MSNLQYLSLPAAAAGLAPASGGTAWTYGSYVEATSSTSTGIYITGISLAIETNPAAADATNEILIEVATGSGGAEVTKLQVPFIYRADTITSANNGLGYWMPQILKQFFPEPYFVPLGTRIAVRATDQKAGAVTYRVKLLYKEGQPPTVALSTPADAATITDTTPDLVFTGTDTERDDIRYNMQIYTIVATDDFNRADNSSTGMNLGANWTATVPNSDLGIISNQAYQTANTGDNAAFYSAVTLANNQYAQVTLSTVGDSYSGLIIRASATDYVIGQAVRGASQMAMYWYNSGTYTQIGSTYSGDVTSGDVLRLEAIGSTFNLYRNSTLVVTGTNGSAPSSGKAGIAIDLDTDRLDNFVCGDIIVNAVSGTDAGFSGSPDNTDPFTSGQAVTYTVQSALTDLTTYYWRVRGIDPTGSNTYGDWATTRSFYLDTSYTPPASTQQLLSMLGIGS